MTPAFAPNQSCYDGGNLRFTEFPQVSDLVTGPWATYARNGITLAIATGSDGPCLIGRGRTA